MAENIRTLIKQGESGSTLPSDGDGVRGKRRENLGWRDTDSECPSEMTWSITTLRGGMKKTEIARIGLAYMVAGAGYCVVGGLMTLAWGLKGLSWLCRQTLIALKAVWLILGWAGRRAARAGHRGLEVTQRGWQAAAGVAVRGQQGLRRATAGMAARGQQGLKMAGTSLGRLVRRLAWKRKVWAVWYGFQLRQTWEFRREICLEQRSGA